MEDAVNGPLLASKVNPMLDAKYAAFCGERCVR